jgi:formylglycine-generating enzyme required for sulfatase activity/serine/threonine protein kinase
MTGQALALTPGSQVDQLRIDRVLGHGAFAITYLVTDTVLEKSFALKEYLPREQVQRSADGRLQPISEQAAQTFNHGMARFLEEGRTVAGLDHPNIVTVFRCFEANGTAYLLMPWYRGEPLHRLLKRSGTFSQEEALALVRPLLNALEYIHGNGVIHQDIKPANIYITEDGKPILLDFGAAGQLIQAGSSTRQKLGSEGYAAPEQAEATAEPGPWTDIYGLAATLYRCITGQIPPAASQRISVTAEKEPDPLKPVGAWVAADAFSAVAGAVEAGLALDPGARPRDLAGWRRQFGAPAEAVSGTGSIGEVEQEGREWLPLILLAVFLVLLASAVSYLFLGNGPQPGDPAVTEAAPGEIEPATPPQHESAEERSRWQDALDSDTAYGYRLFLEDFPGSSHSDQALMHLQRLDHQAWGKAEFEATREAVEAYMDEFPGGEHEAEAKIRLEQFRLADEAAARAESERQRQDSEAWQQARAARTLAAIDGYLAAWPGGLHGGEARALRQQLQDDANERKAFEAARKLNTIEAYESYVKAFPRGASLALALEAIDDLTLRPGKVFSDCADCPSMVVVPAGSYWQGSEEGAPGVLKSETPRRTVTIAEPFAAAVFEITMAQWDLCVAEGGCSTRPRDNGWGRGSRPVIMVSWNDTQEFTNWLSRKTGQSYSLPSESQWEYLARAGEESDWLGGDETRVCEYGNIAGAESGFRWQHEACADSAAMETLPVGSFRPNAFGIHDVVGNVAEWTLDCMNLSYLDAPADGSSWGRGICSSRMTRGGSWFTGTREVRLPARFNLKNGDRNDFTGFRVVRKVEDQ